MIIKYTVKYCTWNNLNAFDVFTSPPLGEESAFLFSLLVIRNCNNDSKPMRNESTSTVRIAHIGHCNHSMIAASFAKIDSI
jgi:hypothetical protein